MCKISKRVRRDECTSYTPLNFLFKIRNYKQSYFKLFFPKYVYESLVNSIQIFKHTKISPNENL